MPGQSQQYFERDLQGDEMITIKGIGKYTKEEKEIFDEMLRYAIDNSYMADKCAYYKQVKRKNEVMFAGQPICEYCEYKHLCRDIHDLLKSGILEK